jgi:hypothetical protein
VAEKSGAVVPTRKHPVSVIVLKLLTMVVYNLPSLFRN